MLVLMTNGQTQADIDKVFLGSNDSPLTLSGKQQVQDTADTLADYLLDGIYSSDLYRAQTAADTITSKLKKPVTVELVEELRERSFGVFEGLALNDVRKTMSPRNYRLWDRDPFDAPQHGESLIEVSERVLPWFDSVVVPRLDKGDNILIITHTDVMRVLIARVRNNDLVDMLGRDIEQGMPYVFYGSPRLKP